MNPLREAAQQALEALKNNAGEMRVEGAISILETTLAQQAEPVEPVAWLDGPHLVVRLDIRDRLNYKGPWVSLGRAIPDKWTPFLYLAPPQRKPLTEEEIEHIGMTHQSLRQVVRAVEKAVWEKNHE